MTHIEKEKFVFNKKSICYILIGIGILSLLTGIFLYKDDPARIWGNILLNNFYFLAFSLCGVVFVAIHNLANAGWQVTMQRIPEAMSAYIPVGLITMILIFFGMHHLYHWSHHDLNDLILEGKSAYLNVPFFFLRMLIYFAIWIFFSYMLRQLSYKEDLEQNIKFFKRRKTISSLFIVLFAISSAFASWDWLMSLDPHWYSTLYAWFIFSGLLVSGLAVITLLVVYLKKQNLLKSVNENHLHDLGKYLFGFSIFWAYLWFSQFLLIWYANIPEETVYYYERFHNYKTLFFSTLFMNFLFPFLILMSRDSKRNTKYLTVASISILIGHWINLYVLIMPGKIKEDAMIGFFEIGLTAGYAGLFLFFVLNTLSKHSLIPENHPYIEESLHYTT